MKLYIVVMMGVYMQGIYGVYGSRLLAESAMEEAKQKETDDYHEFEIRETELNVKRYI